MIQQIIEEEVIEKVGGVNEYMKILQSIVNRHGQLHSNTTTGSGSIMITSSKVKDLYLWVESVCTVQEDKTIGIEPKCFILTDEEGRYDNALLDRFNSFKQQLTAL